MSGSIRIHVISEEGESDCQNTTKGGFPKDREAMSLQVSHS